MPAGSPFTQLCRQLAPRPARADLHLHTTASDGTYTPEEVVDLARRSSLAAVALTDHDTLAGLPAARAAAQGGPVEVIAGVEITAEFEGRELHLLGLFVDPDHEPLRSALDHICRCRVDRYRAMVERLRGLGVSVEEEPLPNTPPAAVGRRHLAEVLVRQGKARNLREAFHRYLADGGPAEVPKVRLPVGEAIALVRQAGGVAAWAHPPYHCQLDRLAELRRLGMDAVETDFPDARPAHRRQLRAWAHDLGLAVTAGSDCHGPGRELGTCSVTDEELEVLRGLGRRG